MTNPITPGGSQDKADGKAKSDSSKESSSLSFSDVMPDQRSKAPSDKQESREPEHLSRPEHHSHPGSFTFKHGQLPVFQIRKGEFLHEKEEMPEEMLKPLIDDLITKTKKEDEGQLSERERLELDKSRDALANATNADDAVLHSLHLARLYQHLKYIEEARKATELALGIDPDHLLAIELFKELERVHPHDVSTRQTTVSAPALSKSNLRRRIANLAQGRVCVVGDMLIDEFLEGKPERISREAPVLILEHVDTELVLGGAANTANNVAALGGSCHAIGITGRDDYAGKLAKLFEASGITCDLVADATRHTMVKTRIVSQALSLKQQLLRYDRVSHENVGLEIEAALIDKIHQSAGNYQAIVLSDYRGGVMTDDVIRACRNISQQSKLALIVDAQDHFERFQNVTLITPNQPDTERACGFTIESPEALKEAGEQLMLLTGAEALLVTRGAEGMALFARGAELFELPVFNKEEVFDVTGAGDTVAATMALAIVSGSSFIEAMALGNLAAGIVVRKPGTATTSQAELLAELEHVNLPE